LLRTHGVGLTSGTFSIDPSRFRELPPPPRGGAIECARLPRVALSPPCGGLRSTRGYSPPPLRGGTRLACCQRWQSRCPMIRTPSASERACSYGIRPVACAPGSVLRLVPTKDVRAHGCCRSAFQAEAAINGGFLGLGWKRLGDAGISGIRRDHTRTRSRDSRHETPQQRRKCYALRLPRGAA